MDSEEKTFKSRLKSIFDNGYLAFGIGVITGLAIDNLMLVAIVAAVVLAIQWYAKNNNAEEVEG